MDRKKGRRMSKGSKRKAIGKSLRFEVFGRDGFTCQYCGRTPPDVLLNIDHIIPVSEGGTNDRENLRTSCAECNAGKTNKQLPIAANETDSLRRTQEAMELVAMAKEFKAANEAREEMEGQIGNLICELTGRDCYLKSNASGVINAIRSFGSEQVIQWLKQAASVTEKYGKVREENMMRYFYGILRRTRQENEEAAQP
jgi:hypothetical protein